MNDQAIRFRVGIFVLASLILLGVMIVLFSGFPNYLTPATTFTIIFDNALGVSPGTPVRRSGVKIGEVRNVSLDNDSGKVRVVIQVDGEFTLRASDRPTIVRGLFGADTAIAFLPPEDQPVDATPVDPGSTLIGHKQPDAGTLVQKTSEIMPEAKEAMVEIKKVFTRLDQMMPMIEETLKDLRSISKASRDLVPELLKTNEEIVAFVKDSRTFLPELRKTNDEFQVAARTYSKLGERVDILLQTNETKLVKSLDNLQEALKNVNALIGPENQKLINDTLKNVQKGTARLDDLAQGSETLIRESSKTLKNVNTTLAKIDEVVTDVQKATRPIGERSESLLRNLDESAVKLNRTLGDFREIMQAIGRSDGTFQRLLSDPALYQSLTETAASVQRLLPRVDRILRDVEIFADKIARHPEALGVGGAVRPSSGLKESPSSFQIVPHP